MCYTDRLIELADRIIPEWRDKSRALKNAFARMLLMRSLRDSGMTLNEIGAIVGKHHTTVIHSLKWLDEAILTQIEMETKERWEAEVKKLREGV